MTVHYLLTRFGEGDWPLLERTLASVKEQTIDHRWLLLADISMPIPMTAKVNSLRKYLKTVWVGKGDWLASLQNYLDDKRKITTRLDPGDQLHPEHLERIEELYEEHLPYYFISSDQGYALEGGKYHEVTSRNGPFLSLVETGNRTVFTVPHGQAVDRWPILRVAERSWVREMPARGAPECERPAWLP